MSRTSAKTSTPVAAVAASMLLTLAALLAFGLAGTSALDAFFYLATIGTLSILVLYVLVSVSAIWLALQARSGRQLLAVVLPAGGAFVALYVLYRNLVPAPAFPFNLFPYIVGAWLVVGLGIALTVPELRSRVSAGLAAR
jgi:amino acid transporter